MAGTPHGPLDAEARMADFTDLVATVIANAETRAQLTASRSPQDDRCLLEWGGLPPPRRSLAWQLHPPTAM